VDQYSDAREFVGAEGRRRLKALGIKLSRQTVILVYVTIPARSALPARLSMADGSINPGKVDTRSLLEMFTIREVSLVIYPRTT
jgi:hypothetical protein